jgi:hypothetical protein
MLFLHFGGAHWEKLWAYGRSEIQFQVTFRQVAGRSLAWYFCSHGSLSLAHSKHLCAMLFNVITRLKLGLHGVNLHLYLNSKELECTNFIVAKKNHWQKYFPVKWKGKTETRTFRATNAKVYQTEPNGRWTKPVKHRLLCVCHQTSSIFEQGAAAPGDILTGSGCAVRRTGQIHQRTNLSTWENSSEICHGGAAFSGIYPVISG